MPTPNRARKIAARRTQNRAPVKLPPKQIFPFPFQTQGQPGRPWNPMTLQLVHIAQEMAHRHPIIPVKELFRDVASRYAREHTPQEAGQMLKRILNRLIAKKVFERIPGKHQIRIGPTLLKPPKR